jgi:hypothetical protein
VLDHGFARLGFADALIAFCSRVDPDWEDAIGQYGYEKAKDELPWFRPRLVEIGMLARLYIDPDVWILPVERRLAAWRRISNAPVVVSDVRFHNEADWIEGNGGTLIAVERPGHLPETTTVEELLLRCDDTVENGGDLHDLSVEVANLVEVEWLP